MKGVNETLLTISGHLQNEIDVCTQILEDVDKGAVQLPLIYRRSLIEMRLYAKAILRLSAEKE